MINPVHKLFDEFQKKYDNILDSTIKDLKKENIKNKDIVKILNSLFGVHKVESKITGALLGLTIKAMIIGGATIPHSSVPAAKQWVLYNFWQGNDLNLKQSIHKNVNKTKAGIAHILKQNLGESVNWQKSARDIYKLKDLQAELPKYMQDLVKQGKKVLQDPALINDFNKKMKIAQKQINKLSNLGYKNNRLKKAYNNIITQVKKGSVAGLHKGIDRAVLAKTKYYAERIARSEISEAYRNSVLWEAKEDKEVIGVKWVLSARHKVPDVCDLWAKGNLSSMGEGVYPKDKVPKYPHPNCMCSLVPVTVNQINRTKRVNKNDQITKFKTDNPNILNKKGEIPLYTNEVSIPKQPEL